MIPYYILTTINIGSLTINVWGLFAGLAFAAALYIALKEARRKNINEDNIFDLAILTLIGGVVGARVAFVLENWDYFSQYKAEIFSFNQGGLMFLGGAIGVMVLFGAYLKLKKLNGWKIIDALVPSFAIGEFIGRIGCALADLHIGTITSLPWAQEYIDGSTRHPISIYMSLNGLVMFIAFWFLRTKVKIEGALFLLFVLWYSGSRFLLDFLRCSDLDVCDPRYSGYTPSQYISAGVFIFSLIYLYNIFNNPPTGGKKHMAEQQNDSEENKNREANEGKNLQDSIVSYTEIDEVIIEGNPDDTEGMSPKSSAGWKNKLSATAKKPWAKAAAFLIVLAIGAIGASVYYNSIYYGNMFKTSPFAFQGKTWISFDDPIVKVTVIGDSKCETCNPQPIIDNLKSGFAPTLSIEEINFDSQKSKDLITKFNIKSVPAFIFDSTVEKLKNFATISPEQMSQIFTKKDNQYYLNPLVVDSIAGQMGITLGRFITVPPVTADDRVKGPDSAKVTIIDFCNYKSSDCKTENSVMQQVLSAYPDKVRVAFKNFFAHTDVDSERAAEAAECAGDQGKFFEMGDMLFANQTKLDAASITKYAGDLKLDAVKFKDCTDSGKFKSKISADSQVAADFGVGGVPAFFVGDQLVSGAITLDQFKQVIDAQLAK